MVGGMLSDSEILKRIDDGDILIYPFDRKRLNPNSYNLCLGTEVIEYDQPILDTRKPNRSKSYSIPPEGMVLWPGRFYLMSTEEWTETRNLVPGIDGRSSVGRLGIAVHITAGFGDVGFSGRWTLEVTAQVPVVVHAGDEICQIYYHTLVGECLEPYHGKYQGSKSTLASMMQKDLDK